MPKAEMPGMEEMGKTGKTHGWMIILATIVSGQIQGKVEMVVPVEVAQEVD